MHDPQLFRRQLAISILGFLGAAALVVPQGACSSIRISEAATGGSATTTTTTTSSSTTTTSGALFDGGARSTTGAGGAGTGGAGVGGGSGGAGGAGDPNPPVEACFEVSSVPSPDAGAGDAGTGTDDAGDGGNDAGDASVVTTAPVDAGPLDSAGCPTEPAGAVAVFQAAGCPLGWEPYQVVSGPTTTAPSQCCYMVRNVLCGPGGRPYLVDDRARVSEAVRSRSGAGRGWTEGAAPVLQGLTAAERALLADAWTADALLEHASVASFSRFSLELMAAGAPADLVEAAHVAALDEIQHARLCFALASVYAGEEVGPGPFPLNGGVDIVPGLAALATSALREGCIGETVAAVIASEQLARATDPAVRAALGRIAADEARHAELAWRTVAWAVKTGGPEVHLAIEQALRCALVTNTRATGAVPERLVSLEAHGRLDAATLETVVASAMADVILPAARTLLVSHPSPVTTGLGAGTEPGLA